MQFNTLAPHRRTLALVVIPPPSLLLLLSGTHTSLSTASSYVAISDARALARTRTQTSPGIQSDARELSAVVSVAGDSQSTARLRSNALTRTGISARFAWLSAAPKWDYVTFLS